MPAWLPGFVRREDGLTCCRILEASWTASSGLKASVPRISVAITQKVSKCRGLSEGVASYLLTMEAGDGRDASRRS